MKELVGGLRNYKCYVKLHGLSLKLLIHVLLQDLKTSQHLYENHP